MFESQPDGTVDELGQEEQGGVQNHLIEAWLSLWNVRQALFSSIYA